LGKNIKKTRQGRNTISFQALEPGTLLTPDPPRNGSEALLPKSSVDFLSSFSAELFMQ